MFRVFGFFANKLMNAFAPIVMQRSYAAMDTSDWLASVEADHDSWEPDELWAARHKLTDPHSPPCGRESVTPAAAGQTSAGEPGGGGHPQPDVQHLMANVDRYFKDINP